MIRADSGGDAELEVLRLCDEVRREVCVWLMSARMFKIVEPVKGRDEHPGWKGVVLRAERGSASARGDRCGLGNVHEDCTASTREREENVSCRPTRNR